MLTETPAAAHGFGERFELPLSLSLYLFGAAATVVVSFLIVGLFVRQTGRPSGYPRINLLSYSIGRALVRPRFVLVLKLIVLVLFLLTVAAGFFGNQNPYRNIAPTMVWIIWWVGLAYFSALVGNLWAVVNPWRTAFEGAEYFFERLTGGRGLALRLRYPEALGVWPVCALLLAFSWIELVYPDPAVPLHIAWFAVAYSALTWTGMFLFGAASWLRHGEVFGVVFGLFARFAPTEMRVRDAAVCAHCEARCLSPGGDCIDCYDCFRSAGPDQREWALRPFAAGLLDRRPASPSITALVLLLLSIVLFDGFLGTPEWSRLEGAVGLEPMAIRSIGLAAFWLVFLGAYLAVSVVIRSVTGHRSASQIARSFVYTLIPIAIGYHVAHYLVFLLIQGQYIVPLLSDPFGFGWNLFGSAGYRVDIAIVGARFAWYAAVASVLLGHVIAVYLAHRRAMQVFDLRQTVLRSQVPLTALMVIYTCVSLTILAEPIVERRAPAEPSASGPSAVAVPESALLPEPVIGRLRAVGPGKTAKHKLTYRVLGSSFHDGTRTSAADILYAYAFAFRWGDRGEGSGRYDPYVDAATAPLRRQLAGLRVVATDATSRTFRVGDVTFVRELFVIELYTTIAPEDPEREMLVAPPWSTLPWHLVVLMEGAVRRGWAAFSRAGAERRGVEWLDLVRSEELKRKLASLVAEFERDGYRPEALESLVSADEARKRWAALAAFHKTYGHFLVTNGPYRLKSWAADRVGLEAFRDLTYPLGVGSYDAYAIPRRGFVTRVEQEKNEVRIFADIETVMKFARDYRIVRQALQTVGKEVVRRASPECRYLVLDAHGQAVLADTIRPAEDGTFRISPRLPAGNYTMLALIAVNENVANAEIRRIPLAITP